MPPEQQCRATTRGMMVRGVYWSPPKRCGNYAVANGYCRLHQQPPEQPAEDAPREARGRDASD